MSYTRLVYDADVEGYVETPSLMDWSVIGDVSMLLDRAAWCSRSLLEYHLSDIRGIAGEPTRDRSGWPIVSLL